MWIGGTDYLWYRKTTSTGTTYVLVNADSAIKQPAFDQLRLAASLTVVLKRTVIADSLPLNNLTFTDDRSAIPLTPDSVRVRCTLADYRCARSPALGGHRPGR